MDVANVASQWAHRCECRARGDGVVWPEDRETDNELELIVGLEQDVEVVRFSAPGCPLSSRASIVSLFVCAEQ